MNDQERAQVLKMIQGGRLTPEEGLRLLHTLEQTPADEEAIPPEQVEAPWPDQAGEATNRVIPDPDVQRGLEITRRLWLFVPLAIGSLVTVLGGWIMYVHLQPSPANVWFFGLGLPLLLVGVAIIVAASVIQNAHWIYLRVEQKPWEAPRSIVLGFPLPFGLVGWILRTFGHFIPDMDQPTIEEIVKLLSRTTSPGFPLVVNVDEGEAGDRVQVYLG
jgi:hypothetical protein